MLRTTRLLSSAALLLGIGGLATPAWAGDACDLNNGPPPFLTAFPGQLYCGTPGSFAQAPNQTAVGEETGIADADTTAVGAFAEASGEGATALGEQSFANLLGFFFSGTLPTGSTSTALGQAAISIGQGTIAIGDHSFVGVVNGSQFTGVQDATAVGSNSTVTADDATAVGFGSTATAAGATAVGQGSSATAANSVAMGAGSSASAAGATAIGQGSSATAANSVALGAGSVADQANTVSVGSAGNERRITNVAAGVNATDAVNVSQLDAVSSNVTALQTDVTANTAAIGTLQTDVTANTSAITTLQTGLADTQSDVAELQSGLADTNAALDDLGNRVDALEAVTSNIDHRLGQVERRADAGTATAVALSGAMYLPDKTFDLSANVGTYRGAVAGALQVGAVVSRNAAVNAGIATAFNKGGKLAARAGFTLGW